MVSQPSSLIRCCLLLMTAWLLASCGGGGGGTPALVSIEVTPNPESLALGTQAQMTATGVYANQTHQDITSKVTWSSSNVAGAPIDPTGKVSALAVGSVTLTATQQGERTPISGSATLAVTPAVLVSIEITPAAPSIAKGVNEQLTATGVFSDQSTQDLTGQVTWSSSSPAVATVSAAGLATAVTPGTVTVTATFGGISAGEALTATDAVLVSIGVTPAALSVAAGLSQQLTATGTYSDNTKQDLTQTAVWSSSALSVATISNVAGSNGLASALVPGSSTITATVGAVAGSATLTVTAATLTSIAVTPADPGVPAGLKQQFTATGTFSDNSTQDLTQAVVWSSSAPSVATISNAAGSNGLARTLTPGSSTITAQVTSSGAPVTASTTLTVTAATLVSIEVTPADPGVAAGLTEQFTATGIFSDSSTQDLTQTVTWASSVPAVATISNAAGSSGLATTFVAGNSTITATKGAVSGSVTLSVTTANLTSIEVTPTAPSVAAGLVEQFTATGTYSDSTKRDLTQAVVWSSSAPSVAAISNATGSNGQATTLVAGTSTITATMGTVAGSTPLTVTAATLVSIEVTPAAATVTAGLKEQFTATGIYSDSSTRNLTQTVTWSSSAAAVATISNAAGTNGLASTLAAGTSTIIATSGAISGDTTLNVTTAVLTSITVTPAAPSVAAGLQEQFTATGTYSDSSTRNLTQTVTWSSSTTAAASISNAAATNGLATTLAPGVSTITATMGTLSGSTTLTVTAATLVSIAVTPTTASVAAGVKEQYTATGTYSDASTRDLTQAVGWTSSAPAVATISNASGTVGQATSISAGSSTITATITGGTIAGSATLTVTGATLVSIAVTPVTASVVAGVKEQFTATGTYSDGSTQNLTQTVTWASSAPAVAIISNATGTVGLASTLTAGSSTIIATVAGGTIAGSATLTVTAATLTSITVTPAIPSVAVGLKPQFTATGTYSDNSTMNLTQTVTWSSSATAVASISNASGTNGQATALTVGSSTITATIGTLSASTTLTVTAATLVSIAVTPATVSVAAGLTEQFTATGTYSDGSTQTLTQSVGWTSSAPAVATISNASGSVGLATTLAIGSSTITATITGGTIAGTATLTVTAANLLSIAVTPATAGIVAGLTQQFTATGTYSDGSTRNLTQTVGWTSSAPAVASISNAAGTVGQATGLTAGSSTITATIPGGTIAGSATLTVTAATLVSIAVTPGTASVAAGVTQQFTATGSYTDGSTQNLTQTVTWASSAPAVAIISNAAGTVGLATTLTAGSSTIIATMPGGGVAGTASLTVTAATLVSIAVTPAMPSVAAGLTQQFAATGTYTDGSTQDLTQTVVWASDTPAVATISNITGTIGLATTLAAGTCTISATVSGGTIAGTTMLTVTAAPAAGSSLRRARS